MSELITDMPKKRKLLKEMILHLHKGEAPETVQKELAKLLGEVPYGLVVGIEQELIQEGLPTEEVLKLCDIHGKALKGIIDLKGAKSAMDGHPIDTFKKENSELAVLTGRIRNLINDISNTDKEKEAELSLYLKELRLMLNSLFDVDKHYRRKENLLFPYLEKKGITGPPTVMWGKHDETRALLKAANTTVKSLQRQENLTAEQVKEALSSTILKAIDAVEEMIYKEEQILFPTSMDKLNDSEWYSIYLESPEIGFCLYDPKQEWKPSGIEEQEELELQGGKIRLPSGTFTVEELISVLNTLPFDITFVDKDDKVRYFTQGKERIFDRNRSILGRKVQMCHPPSSVHVVEKILADFHSGKKDSEAFWLNLKGKFIHIEYFAVRDKNKSYIGTLEVTQDLTDKRNLAGERRLMSN
ncbi:MAG: DUF438 domain-containing protein [Spirochaetales bacterium]|nr:DUF438 domain-containing protein [Spirochaetales bacterium]